MIRLVTVLVTVLVTIGAQAQALTLKNGQPVFELTQEQAANVDYWARKGLASEPLVNSLQLELKLINERASTQDLLLRNNSLLIAACTGDNDRLGKRVSELSELLRKAETDALLYQDKARRRGQTIGIMVGAAAAIVGGYILTR